MEVDFWDGTLLLLESLEESVVLKLARERRRRSLRKAMDINACGSVLRAWYLVWSGAGARPEDVVQIKCR